MAIYKRGGQRDAICKGAELPRGGSVTNGAISSSFCITVVTNSHHDNFYGMEHFDYFISTVAQCNGSYLSVSSHRNCVAKDLIIQFIIPKS